MKKNMNKKISRIIAIYIVLLMTLSVLPADLFHFSIVQPVEAGQTLTKTFEFKASYSRSWAVDWCNDDIVVFGNEPIRTYVYHETWTNNSFTNENFTSATGYLDQYDKVAQKINVTVTGQITNIALNVQKNNTPTGNYYLFLRKTIDGTDMGYAYNSVGSITTGWNNFSFVYPYPWIDTPGDYYLVFYGDTAQTPPNNVLWGADNTTAYPNGIAYTYNGTAWNEYPDWNCSFIIYNTTSYAPGFTDIPFYGYGTTGGGVHFSSDGNWFAEASFGGYAISAWQRKGYNFYQLPAPPNQLSGTHYAVGISSNGTYLAGGSDSSPRLRLWKRNESDNNNFTQLSDPATMPPAYCTVYDIEFNPADDSYLAVSGYTFCYIYKRDNDTFTYLTGLDADCQESKCAWSKDGNYFGACFRDSPYFRVWKRNGDTFTALSVDTSITSRGRGIAISSDGKYVSVGYNSYPYFAWYQNKDDKLYKQNPPGDDYTVMPATSPWDCGFSDSDKYLALAVWVSSDTYPVGIIYNLTTTIPKPTVSDATNVGTYYATFNGYMDDGGDNTTWHYEYGENTSYQDTLGNMTTIATDSTTTNKVVSFLSDNDGSYNMPSSISYDVTIKKAGYFSALSVVKYGTTTTVTVKDSSDNVLASRTHSMIGGDNRLVTETFLPTDYTRMFVEGENITVTFSGGNWQISGGSSTTRDSDYCYISSQALPNRRDPVGVFTMLEYAVPPLNPGTLYHYRMVGNNSLGTNYSSDSLFVTKPLASTSINTTLVGNTNNITWIKGIGANNTYIEYKNGSVSSWSIGEGNFLYNGTGTYCLHENLPKGRYTYMLFGYSEWTYNGTTYYQYGDTTPIYGGYKDDPIYKSRAKYVYVAGYNPDDRIHQYWASNLTYRTQTFDLLRYIRWDVVADDDYIYVDYSGDADAYVYQVRSTDMTPIAGINDGMNYGLYTFAIDDDFVYHFGKFGGYYWSIKQFSKTDMTRTADTGSLGVIIYAMDIDDTYIYGGGGDYLIYKFLKSDMSTVATSASYGGEIRGLAVDDNYIYIGGLTTQTIKRYWKSNLTYIDQSSSYGGDIYTLKIDDDYIYVGGDGTYKAYKYYKSNLTKAGETASYGSTIYTLEVDDTYLYIAGDAPYKINKYKKSDLSYVSQSASFTGTVYGLALDSPPLIDLVSPSDNGYLMEQTTANLTVDVCNFYEPINVTFYNASDNSMLTQYNDVETGTYYYNWENLAVDYTYSWYVVVNGTTDNLKSDTYFFTPTRTPKVINFRIDEINDNNITIRWDNQPEMAWISFAISSRLSEVRKILGSQQEWFVPSMLKDTEYALVWQVGDNYSQMSDYHQFNFTTGGWASLPELTNYGYRLLVTINHTEVGSDLENYAYDLNLTDDTFRYEQDWVSYPGFTHLNWTTLDDIRFVDYYRTKYLEYNVSNMDIPGDGGISTQVVPDENYSTGSFATEDYAHDTDWLTQATPASYGILYYNYTIPIGAKITSKFRVYQGEWIWDVTLPEGAYNGSKLQFKSECDYDTPYIATSVWNYETSTWDMIQNDTARYFYESQIGWEYDAYASVYVMPEHFNDTSLENEKGIDGDYDTKFWMYYGYTGATDAQTTLSYDGVYGGSSTLGTEEEYVVYPPVISNITEYNGTATSMNVTWTTDTIADGRIRYATNQWMLNSTWVAYNTNKTEVFEHLYGNETHTVKLYPHSTYYISTIDVNCSDYNFSNNPAYYYVNSSTGDYPVEVTFNDTGTTQFLNWTVEYTYNKTIEWDMYNPDFIISGLTTDTKYYYQILASNEGGNTTEIGDFTLGTPPSTPQGIIEENLYDEDRPNETVTIWANLTDMDGDALVDCSIQYWNETSTDFSETSVTQKNSIGTLSKIITVDYGHTYYYRLKMEGDTTGYSDVYSNEFMAVQEFFAGSYIEDEDNNGLNTDYRDRQYLAPNPDGTVNLSAYPYTQYGYWEGSLQEEDWMWVETNISTEGTLTLHLYTKEYGHAGDYTLSVDADSGMRYIKLTGLNNSWYTFYISGDSGIVLNWTKPSLIHRDYESRTDESKYVSFDNTPTPVDYTLLYLNTQDVNTSAYRWSISSGLDLYTAMVVEYWGGGRESGLTSANTGTEYDRGQLFRGGIWNGEPYDTGTLEPTRPSLPMGAYRYCFAFTTYWWNTSLLPSNNITNYYYRYWSLNSHWSDYLGYYQDRLFDYNYLMQFKYDLVSYTRDWKEIDNTTINEEKRVDNATQYVFNTTSDQSLLYGYKDGFSFDPSNDQIWNFGLYTDGRWTNQQVGQYQQAFVIFNLPDNTTLQGMDSDSDNLTDYDELFTYYTNPKSNDTDEDSYSDGAEIENATDPNIFSDIPTTLPVIETRNATYIGTNYTTSNGYITSTGGEGETAMVWFEYGTNTSYGNTTSSENKSWESMPDTFSHNITGINAGTLYHYRAVANNTIGTSYGEDATFLTKPNAPTGLIVTNNGFGQQSLSWSHGAGYNKSVIRRNLGSYPSSPTSGIAVYNNTGTSTSVGGLGDGEDWYYRAWEYAEWIYNPTLYQFSDSSSSDHEQTLSIGIPVVTTNSPTYISETNATLNGHLDSDGLETCTVSFEWGYNTSYGYWTTTQSKTTGQSYHIIIDSLTPKTTYHYRAVANNSAGTGYGNDIEFNTTYNPPAPTATNFNPTNGSTIPINTPNLSCNISDSDGNLITYNMSTSLGNYFNGTSYNGTILISLTLPLSYSESFTWTIDLTNGYNAFHYLLSYTTETYVPPAPIPSGETPQDLVLKIVLPMMLVIAIIMWIVVAFTEGITIKTLLLLLLSIIFTIAVIKIIFFV